ncbi:Mysoin-binding motif of peroxisomes domain-containing protein [Trichoderma chlorosporum]
MEPVVYEETPLADYLRDGGNLSEAEWAPMDGTPDRQSLITSDSSPPASPTPFAPSGRPLVKARFRSATSKPELAEQQPQAQPLTLESFKKSCSALLAVSLDRADNARFIEQFRYTIIASQLLSGHSLLGHRPPALKTPSSTADSNDQSLLSTEGIIVSVVGALALAVFLSWALSSAPWHVTKRRLILVLIIAAAAVLVGQVFVRRQWLRYRREQALSEISTFISNSQNFDSATEATLSLVQEVELVSRGYRISVPLAPVSRLEDRTQNRKCVRLRKALKNSLAEILQTYNQVSDVVRGFAEQMELEKYYDMYDVSDFDISDSRLGFNAAEFDDLESLRTLKILAARFHTTRKMLLCALLALDANGEVKDLLRWTAAVESLQSANISTKSVFEKLQGILSEEESFPAPPTPQLPLTPGKERWRSQLRKISSMSTGIRGLQAKLHLLREESDRALDDSNDISEMGPNLMSQYDSIGVDLRMLMAAWEEGRAALAQGIDRNEKRLSSISTLLSPASSLSGLTTIGEGGAAEAFKALTGESPPASDINDAEEDQEIFEAVAKPRPRSLLTREERIAKVKEDREHRALARQQMEATKGMLRELETVISLRPQKRASAPAGSRKVSM